MHDFLLRLTSRKFLLAVSSITALLAAKQYPEAITVVLGYLGVEAAIDFKGTSKTAINQTYNEVTYPDVRTTESE